jgi:magnesium-transporting ATPase (P-type)
MDKTVLFRGYVFLGLLEAVSVLVIYYFVLYQGGWRPGMRLEPDDTTFANPLHLKAITMVFLGIVVMQVANVFACRSDRHSASKLGFFSNKLIWVGIIFELILASAIIYAPFLQDIFQTTGVGWADWGILFIFAVLIFLAEELRKRLCCRRHS